MYALMWLLLSISISFAENTRVPLSTNHRMGYDRVIMDIRRRIDVRVPSTSEHIDNAIQTAAEYVLWEKRRMITKTMDIKISSAIPVPNDLCMILHVEHCHPNIGCTMMGNITEVPDDIPILAWEYCPGILKIYHLEDPRVDNKSMLRIHYISWSSAPQFVDQIAEKLVEMIKK